MNQPHSVTFLVNSIYTWGSSHDRNVLMFGVIVVGAQLKEVGVLPLPLISSQNQVELSLDGPKPALSLVLAFYVLSKSRCEPYDSTSTYFKFVQPTTLRCLESPTNQWYWDLVLTLCIAQLIISHQVPKFWDRPFLGYLGPPSNIIRKSLCLYE